jgi:hypothetical protein
VISLAAVALLNPNLANAQTKPRKIYDVDWPQAAPPASASHEKAPAPAPPAPVLREEVPLPAPPPVSSGADPRVKAVTFTPPTPMQVQNLPGALLLQQPGGGRPKLPADGDTEFTIRFDPPGPDLYFRRESENQVFDRILQEAQARPGAARVVFPERAPPSRDPYEPRRFLQMVAEIEPAFVMHRRLFFEQPNFDRYGSELGALQPGISTLRFFYDVALLPYHKWSYPRQHWDSSAGKLLPGDVVPLYWQREPLTLTGLTAQAMAITGGLFALP